MLEGTFKVMLIDDDTVHLHRRLFVHDDMCLLLCIAHVMSLIKSPGKHQI